LALDDVFDTLKLKKWLSREEPILYYHFEEKQGVQIFDLVSIAFTEWDESIRLVVIG